MQDTIQFSVNGVEFEILSAPCSDRNGIKAWSKWVWSTDDNEGRLCNTADEAQQDAMEYARQLAWEASEKYAQEMQSEAAHILEISCPRKSGRI